MTGPRWPSPGEAVAVNVRGGAAQLRAVVEDCTDGVLVLREPFSPTGGDVAVPELGAGIVMTWTTSSGWHECRAVFDRVRTAPLRHWVLRQSGTPTVIQRREFARAPEAMPARLRSAGRAVDVVLTDLSEGGARCVARHPAGLVPGDPVELDLVLEDQPLTVQAELLEVVAVGDDRTQVRLRFVDLGRRARLVRRHVLVQQQRARAVSR